MFSKPILIAALVAILSIGAWGATQWGKLQHEIAARAKVETERDTAIRERDALLEINKKNEAVIAQLRQEKADNEAAIAALEERRKKDTLRINKLNKIINDQRSNPANQVELSPVLQTVLQQLLRDRQARAAGIAPEAADAAASAAQPAASAASGE